MIVGRNILDEKNVGPKVEGWKIFRYEKFFVPKIRFWIKCSSRLIPDNPCAHSYPPVPFYTPPNFLWLIMVKYQSRLTAGWGAGWLAGSVSDYSTTSWLHLASWNLPDPQLSWESKMEPRVAINSLFGYVLMKIYFFHVCLRKSFI